MGRGDVCLLNGRWLGFTRGASGRVRQVDNAVGSARRTSACLKPRVEYRASAETVKSSLESANVPAPNDET